MKRLLIILLALLSALVLTGCATRRQLQVVDRITHDTLCDMFLPSIDSHYQ